MQNHQERERRDTDAPEQGTPNARPVGLWRILLNSLLILIPILIIIYLVMPG